jgi:hypothetical protein
MNILHYDHEKYDYEDIYAILSYFRDKGIDIIAIPKDIELLIDCDTFTLTLIKQKIEEAIRLKEIIEN